MKTRNRVVPCLAARSTSFSSAVVPQLSMRWPRGVSNPCVCGGLQLSGEHLQGCLSQMKIKQAATAVSWLLMSLVWDVEDWQ